MKAPSSLLLFLLLSGLPAVRAHAAQDVSARAGFELADATPVRLRLVQGIASDEAHVDDRVNFEVLEDIRVNDIVVIPKGSLAWATLAEPESKRRLGRGGKFAVNIGAVRLADGDKVALRAVKDARGAGREGATTVPAAALFLFALGKDENIPEGREVTAYISGDVNLDPAKFGLVATGAAASASAAAVAATAAPASSPSGPSAPASEASTPSASVPSASSPPQDATPARASEPSIVSVKSTPDGADITVDGKHAGSTPSTLRLEAGDHAIVVEKAGFKPWQRTITVNKGGTINIDATLEKTQ